MVSDMDILAKIKDSLLKSIEGKKAELDKHRPLSQSILNKLHKEFVVEWTYNTNAIEGNTISLHETELVLNRGLTIGNKTLKEHLELINHKKGIEFIESYIKKKGKLSKNIILELHKILFEGIDENAGQFRRSGVRILGATHIPPNPLKLNRLMDEVIEWYYVHYKKIPVSELAAWVHYKLVYIHPFTDGNGRISRLIMNLILMQNGYPPAVILNLDRKKYYRVLKESDNLHFENYLNFIGKAIERSLIIYLNACKPESGKTKQGYITLKEATKYCDYSMEYLSFLARKNILPAVKFNRNWMTTREEVEEYSQKQKK